MSSVLLFLIIFVFSYGIVSILNANTSENIYSSVYEPKNMQLVSEIKFSEIFKELSEIKDWEASGVIYRNGSYYVIFDNLFGFAKVNELDKNSNNKFYITGDLKNNSGYEAIMYDSMTNKFVMTIETVDTIQGMKPQIDFIEEIDDKYHISKSCIVDFIMKSENKGFEGSYLYNTKNGKKLLFGLCEGNNCTGGDESTSKGNGKIIVSEYLTDDTSLCQFKYLTTWNLPSYVKFTDYSDLAYNENSKKMAITSQEDSMLWIVKADLDTQTFKTKGDFYIFPKNTNNQTVYCNIEGVDFIDDKTIVCVSDKMKDGNKQEKQCSEKDQSIHIFKLL